MNENEDILDEYTHRMIVQVAESDLRNENLLIEKFKVKGIKSEISFVQIKLLKNTDYGYTANQVIKIYNIIKMVSSELNFSKIYFKGDNDLIRMLTEFIALNNHDLQANQLNKS